MPTGVYKHKTGVEHHQWKGGLPVCIVCGVKLTQHRSPSALKRGVKQRCRDCYIKDVKNNARQKVCKNCGAPVSRAGKRCKTCYYLTRRGIRVSPKTEFKPGVLPKSHLRDNFGNKYNVSKAVDRTYKGVVYHSKMEANYAAYLDFLKRAGEILDWEGQYPFDITINGVLIARYYCDFKVRMKDSRIEFHEVKGAVTELYTIKKKAVEALYDVKIKEIKQKDMKALGIL